MLICILYTCSFIARKLGQGVFKGEIMQSWEIAGELSDQQVNVFLDVACEP